jgi:crotonobetainyl-CoA:carnitine CoA-transferase CaiB-like acyl-CoA transferase
VSGSIGLTRDCEGNPVWCRFAIGDITAAVAAHAAIDLALRNPERFSAGKLVDLALVECMLPMVSVALGRVQVEDEKVSDFAGSNAFHGIPDEALNASDGAVCVGANMDDFLGQIESLRSVNSSRSVSRRSRSPSSFGNRVPS